MINPKRMLRSEVIDGRLLREWTMRGSIWCTLGDGDHPLQVKHDVTFDQAVDMLKSGHVVSVYDDHLK